MTLPPDIFYWERDDLDEEGYYNLDLISLNTGERAFTIWFFPSGKFTVYYHTWFSGAPRSYILEDECFEIAAKDDPFFIKDPILNCEEQVMRLGHRMATAKELLLK